jgi:hypothetical protein
MRAVTRLLALTACVVIFGMVAAPNAMATIPEGSYLRLAQPLDVGGTILQPGVYVIKVLPSIGNRNLLQVTNEDQSKVFATVLSIPHAIGATNDQGNTSFVYYPAVAGTPQALRTWFAPDSASGGGHDIVYPKPRAMELAAVVKAPVVAYTEVAKPEELATTTLVVVTPEKVVTAYVEPAPAPKPVMVAEAREMPRTAGRIPLVVTLGVMLLCAAVGVRVLRAG